MAKKETPNHFARARDHRDCEIALHRQVTFRHTVIRRILSVAWIELYVVDTHDSLAAKGWTKEIGGARHREMCKRFARHARQRVKHVRRAFIIQHVVEE